MCVRVGAIERRSESDKEILSVREKTISLNLDNALIFLIILEAFLM